jgi:phosphate transport system substrate-binding protein
VFTKVARDAICMITHPSNTVGNLSRDQISTIFTSAPGSVSWASVGGTVGGNAAPVGRAATSGTHDAFRNIFLAPASQNANIPGKASNGLVQQTVKGDPQGIGYVSLAFTSGVHVVNYNGVACNLRNAISGAYGGVRNFWYVTRGTPAGGAKKFINWATHSKKARNIVSTEWVPLG